MFFIFLFFAPLPRAGGVLMSGVARRGPPSPLDNKRRRIASDQTCIGDGLVVPNLAVGTIAWTPERKVFLPGDAVVSKAGTAEKQRNLAQLALDFGLTLFDTAERYSVGAGEMLLANAVSDGSRTPVMATKFTPTPWRTGPDAVVEACRASRDRLGVDKIDLYQIHMPDIVQPLRVFGYVNQKDRDYWEGLARCVEQGLCKEVGVSNYGPTLLRECYEFLEKRGVRLATNQIHYSLLARHQGGNQESVDAARELGVKTLAYYPLAMGLLSSSSSSNRRGSQDSKECQRGPLSHYKNGGTGYIGLPWVSPENVVHVPEPGVLPLVQALETVANKYDKTPSQVALNWIITKGVIPIVGATTEKYLEDAAGALGWRLTEGDCEYLERASDDLGFEFKGTWFKRVDSKFVGYGIEKWTLD